MNEIRVDPETGEVLDDAATEEQFNELEDGDGEPEQIDNEPAPEPEPSEPEDTGPSLEAVMKLGRSFETYAKKVGDTYEEDAQYLYPCPLCPDNHKGFVDLRAAGQVPGEIAAEVHSFLTGSNVGDFEQDPGTKKCPTCEGKTVVKTGAISGQWITRTCPGCGGYGFTPPPSNVVGAAGLNGAGGVLADVVELPQPQEDVDEWGEPRILPDGTLNANYGMMPNRKTVHPVYGVTAQLTTQAV